VFSCALALLASCGGKPWSQAMSGGNPSARLAAAVTRTTDAHTADFVMDLKGSVSGAGSGTKTAGISPTRSIAFTNQAAQMTLKASSADGSEQGEMRILGSKEYIRKGGNWSSNDVSDSSDSFGNGDPTQYLHYLGAVSTDVHVVGPDKIDGADVDTYAGTIDV